MNRFRLDALSKFLEKQKALLKKTQADLDQLRTLRQCASVQPTQLLLGLESQVSNKLVVNAAVQDLSETINRQAERFSGRSAGCSYEH